MVWITLNPKYEKPSHTKIPLFLDVLPVYLETVLYKALFNTGVLIMININRIKKRNVGRANCLRADVRRVTTSDSDIADITRITIKG